MDYTRAFITKLSTFDWLSAPEVRLEDDGDIGFDWDMASGVVSAYISETGRAGWAALCGGYRSHGTFQWPEWPDELTNALRHVMGEVK